LKSTFEKRKVVVVCLIIPCLHDKASIKQASSKHRANVKQTSSNQNTRRPRVFWIYLLANRLTLLLYVSLYSLHPYVWRRVLHCKQTFNADVAGFQIPAEVAWTRKSVLGQAVHDGRDSNLASPSAGAPGVELLTDVQLTAKVAVVERQTAAEPHAPVVSRSDQNDFIGRRTTSAKCLTLAVLPYFATRCNQTTTSCSSHVSLLPGHGYCITAQ